MTKDNTPSKEQLLNPRYKVIADYPESMYDLGEILTLSKGDDKRFTGQYYAFTNGGAVTVEWLDRYGHLFKKMEWWEDRKADELPQYVISGYGKVDKVISWDGVSNEGVPMFWYKTQEGQTTANNVKWLQPSDETEYQQYLNSLTK